jgi:hypothetical protein
MPDSISESAARSFEAYNDPEQELLSAPQPESQEGRSSGVQQAEFQEGSSSEPQVPGYSSEPQVPDYEAQRQYLPTYQQDQQKTSATPESKSGLLAGFKRRAGYAGVALGVSKPTQRQVDHQLRKAVGAFGKPIDDPEENPSGVATIDFFRERRMRGAPAKRLAQITKALDKGANPATPSKSGQNTFHKLANALDPSQEITDLLMAKTSPKASLGAAARAQDEDGNTPIHLAEYNRGQAHAEGFTTEAENLRYLADALTAAATPMSGRTLDTPVQNLTNNESRTPAQMYERGLERGRLHELDDRRPSEDSEDSGG